MLLRLPLIGTYLAKRCGILILISTLAFVPSAIAAVTAAFVAALTSFLVAQMTARSFRERLRAELRTEFMAEEVIHQLLSHQTWTLRSFEIRKRHIRGLSEDELRKMLIGAGALAFDDKSNDGTTVEYWGLRTRICTDSPTCRLRRTKSS